MTINHTPGPWHPKKANSSIPIVAANGKTVASVRFRDNDSSDANLIAAAPDLLKALKLLLDHANLGAYDRAAAVRAAHAAIQKATPAG